MIALTRATSPSTVPPAANVAHPRGSGNARAAARRIAMPGIALLGCRRDPRRAVSAPLPAGTALPARSFRKTTSSPVRARMHARPVGDTWSAAMLKLLVRTAVAAVVVIAAGTLSPPLAQQQSLTIFAAASMKNALDDINAAFTKKTSIKTVASYAATSALMRQIEQGAPADIFASADLEWMDYGLKNKLINPSTRVNLLGNRLVLIAPKDSKIDDGQARKGLRPRQARRRRPHRHRRREVGAGRPLRHGRAARSSACGRRSRSGWRWSRTCASALTLVARGEAALGIVYETDAKVEPGVKIVGALPGRLASGDRLSGRRDRQSERRGAALHRLPAIGDVEVDVREVRLQLPGQADVVTPRRRR